MIKNISHNFCIQLIYKDISMKYFLAIFWQCKFSRTYPPHLKYMNVKQTAFKKSFSQDFLFLTRTRFRNVYQGINKSCVRAFNWETAKSAIIYQISSLIINFPNVIKNNEKNGQNLFLPVRALNTRGSIHVYQTV